MIVKFLAKSGGNDPVDFWKGFMPHGESRIGDVEFVFRKDCAEYDWLVVYDDLPSSDKERFPHWNETLACPREKTIFITAEPSTIKVYGKKFLEQFGHVLTSQEPWAIDHPHTVRSQCGLIWFYGKPFSEAARYFPEDKSLEISTVCSSKKQRHTLHSLRYHFTDHLKVAIPELEVFGHGHRFIESKVEALDPFKYHLAIENHVATHHWTEKLSDTFLGGCLPIYHGAPNIFDYFPEESLIQVDIRVEEQTIATIKETIENGEYEKRLPAIREARRLILEDYSTFPMIAKLVGRLEAQTQSFVTGGNILSRHLWRKRHPFAAASYVAERFLTGRKAQQERVRYLTKL